MLVCFFIAPISDAASLSVEDRAEEGHRRLTFVPKPKITQARLYAPNKIFGKFQRGVWGRSLARC